MRLTFLGGKFPYVDWISNIFCHIFQTALNDIQDIRLTDGYEEQCPPGKHLNEFECRYILPRILSTSFAEMYPSYFYKALKTELIVSWKGKKHTEDLNPSCSINKKGKVIFNTNPTGWAIRSKDPIRSICKSGLWSFSKKWYFIYYFRTIFF